MDISDIKKYYKIFGSINLIFAILLVFFLYDIKIEERVYAFLAINVGYHMLYHFFSSLSKNSIRSANNFNKIVGTIMLKLFAIFGVFCSFFIIFIFVSTAIAENEYIGLFAICIAIGLFLGSYSLWLDLKNE
ncbi:hypothetical protein G5B37_03460 [Rasiella rasia]|uniref:Uncharacterized protein n=1 Tax=Rasiella rasia TaxID=2744027 RepID=A0A6G6GJH4_9FLAO|nr:hypothetical protein [Rasiella rasia]QIE58650.1 hypothetical protein G5B37_03460 [Rasiella rasia]